MLQKNQGKNNLIHKKLQFKCWIYLRTGRLTCLSSVLDVELATSDSVTRRVFRFLIFSASLENLISTSILLASRFSRSSCLDFCSTMSPSVLSRRGLTGCHSPPHRPRLKSVKIGSLGLGPVYLLTKPATSEPRRELELNGLWRIFFDSKKSAECLTEGTIKSEFSLRKTLVLSEPFLLWPFSVILPLDLSSCLASTLPFTWSSCCNIGVKFHFLSKDSSSCFCF